MRKNLGFTLIELVFVLGIIAAIAVIAIPKLLAARMDDNERFAIDLLKKIAIAEVEYAAMVCVDEDGDGKGEYGGLGELIGIHHPRGSLKTLEAPPLADWRMSSARTGNADFQRSGYRFRLYLRDRAGWKPEPAEGFRPGDLFPNQTEAEYCVLAIPQRMGETGQRMFLLDADGKIRSAPDPAAFATDDFPTATLEEEWKSWREFK